jgi:hypothetical protein
LRKWWLLVRKWLSLQCLSPVFVVTKTRSLLATAVTDAGKMLQGATARGLAPVIPGAQERRVERPSAVPVRLDRHGRKSELRDGPQDHRVIRAQTGAAAHGTTEC